METVTLVVLVLVLRRLSGRFPDDPTVLTRRIRALLGVAVGAVIGAGALLATGSRVHAPAGVGLVSLRERAAELGGSCTVECPAGGGTVVRAVLPASGGSEDG